MARFGLSKELQAEVYARIAQANPYKRAWACGVKCAEASEIVFQMWK